MIHFCVFFSPAFESRARVCIESIRKHHPESLTHGVPIVSGASAGSYIEGFHKARFKWMREKLLELNPEDRLVFAGADCKFYSPATAFLNMAARHNIVLVPHVTQLPTTRAARLYQTGHANGDIFSFSPAALPVIDWLLNQDMSDRQREGIFYEQTWLSALPFIADGVAVYRRPDMNIAWFNAHERFLVYDNGNFRVNSTPLVMAHFTGYQKGEPTRLSRYGTVDLARFSAWKHLIEEYDAAI